MTGIGGHWRKPRTLEDARQITDIVIDQMDPEWLLGFGIELLGVSDVKEEAVAAWVGQRRPLLRQCLPYFIFVLSINIFFCLVLRAQLPRNVKPSHHIDLAYLYYLSFCSVFTSKNNFHIQVAPFFVGENQTFVNGAELKEDLKKLVERCSALDESDLKQGLTSFARHPPDETTFLTTRLGDQHAPKWREASPPPEVPP